MQFIDIHSHVQFVAYEADRDAVILRAKEGNTKMINVGTQKDTSKAAVELAHQYPDIAWATIGLHPIHTSKSFHDKKELGDEGEDFTSRGEVFDYDYYLELGKDPRVVGIGECGLDYYRLNHETRNIQHETFKKHIELALELDKPLMIHCRDAYDDLLAMLDSRSRGNIHFFAGSWDVARRFLDLGFTLSFTGVITFADQYDEVVKNTPLDMILTETDSPYITPAPLRGKRNEPVNVQYVVARIAELKGLPVEQVSEQIMQNAKRVFGI
ncbi:MAG: TatD family hydrolase [Patescibacteria group bacterium]